MDTIMKAIAVTLTEDETCRDMRRLMNQVIQVKANGPDSATVMQIISAVTGTFGDTLLAISELGVVKNIDLSIAARAALDFLEAVIEQKLDDDMPAGLTLQEKPRRYDA
jgi:hypothetical protein